MPVLWGCALTFFTVFMLWILARTYTGTSVTVEDWSGVSVHAYPECNGPTQIRMYTEDGVNFKEFQCLGSCGGTLSFPYTVRGGCE